MTTITIYRPTHEAACTDVPTSNEQEVIENQKIYDEHESAYFEYVRAQLADEGFELEISATDYGTRTYSVEADNSDDTDRAHYLMSQGAIKDFWDWHN